MSVPTSSETGRQRAGWMPAPTVYSASLPIGNAHAAHALVADAQDALVVRDDDHRRVGVRVAQDLLHAAAVVRRDVDAARATEDAAPVAAGLRDDRRVDHRRHLPRVRHEQAVEERLVAVLQAGQEDVAGEVAGDVLVGAVHAVELFFDRVQPLRQQAAQR